MSSRNTEWKKPGIINSFTVTMFIVLIAGGYAGWRFVPVYFDAWSVDHLMKEALSEIFRTNHMKGSQQVNTQRKLIEKLQLDIRKKAGVFDPDLSVELENDEEKNEASIIVEYNVTVSHPVLFPPTHLHMKRVEKISLKRVEW